MVKADKWRFLAVGLLLTTATGAAKADSLDAQRQRYTQIKQAWDANQLDVVSQLMPTLTDYPLYPYLEYRQLTQNIATATPQQVTAFVQANPTLPPARSLPARFVNELANRQDWQGLLAFSPQAPKPVAARCNYYFAKWSTGQQQVAFDGAKDIWLTGTSLPTSCDKLFTVWQQAGNQTALTTLQRIGLAMKAGNTNLVNYLAKQLPPDYQTMSDALVKLQNDPSSIESFARTVGPTDFTRNAVTIAFSRVVSADVENARSMLPVLARLQKMDDSDRLALEEAVAWRYMGNDATPEQAAWRDNVILRSHSTSLVERRIRMSLASGDRKGLARWMQQLPADAMQEDEWRYWHASVLMDQGKRAEAESILRTLMQGRGFYPMAAAQKLNVAYPLTIDVAPKPDASLGKLAEVVRVRELMYWNMDNLARTEWTYLVLSRSRSQQEALARYAFEKGWPELSVQATIAGKLWDSLQERFPLAWSSEFRQATENKGITQSYAMAIARQESAWNPQARSPVGASGLMQLMPATAQHTVQMNAIPGYTNSSQLFDPQTNITIGTGYLEYVYQMFGRNRILSSAAYNAGPSRVNTWLGNTQGQVDAVAFVESIPFSETRRYVKNVLAYDAFYRYFLHQPAKILTDAEWQRRY
ncbi:murein transglycosylase [Rouxiella silvae]|uniref:peptidoglycan lytic exotransglycosylase n=1 Tax=Rouxiella silvae TaxID=1646373 RepID=A0AA41BYJ1_9GAMM|nr:murein transglycosylase [Rouxiella silvae]MBF6639104.1 murein transglycosylase [Rouxiella silvae]